MPYGRGLGEPWGGGHQPSLFPPVPPSFSQNLQQMLRDLAPNCTVTFLQSEDGSGKGAALVAAVACRGADPRGQPPQ